MKRIESKQNAHVKKWKKLHAKKERDRNGRFLIEGPHLIEEALQSGVKIDELIVQDGFDMSSWAVNELPMVEVPESIFKEISDTEHPQGVAAVCCKLAHTTILEREGKYLLIDNVQDPGNIGTMIRTADSAGMTAVVLGKGCADPYNSKVLRATQGSLFHLPVIQADLAEWTAKCKQENIKIFGTSLQGQSYKQLAPVESFALIVGNEGSGVDLKLLEQTDENMCVPIYGKAESLNVSVATGILLYHLRE